MNETALKDRLKIIAKEKGLTFNEIWKQFLLERFLARLSRSKHQEKFIFKGGLLLAQYIVIGRETIDADFLMRRLKSEVPSIQSAFIDIISIDLRPNTRQLQNQLFASYRASIIIFHVRNCYHRW